MLEVLMAVAAAVQFLLSIPSLLIEALVDRLEGSDRRDKDPPPAPKKEATQSPTISDRPRSPGTPIRGARGTTFSPLRPTGIATFDGRRLEVSSEGEFVESGAPVVVSRVVGQRVFVRLADKADSPHGSPAPGPEVTRD